MKFICCLAILTLFSVQISYAGRPNPSAVYAEKMGYTYQIIKTVQGQRGVVVVEPGVSFDAWDFLKGKVGNAYGYGAQFGYDTVCVTQKVGAAIREYAVCVPKSVRKTGSIDSTQTEIPLLDLMRANGEPLMDEFDENTLVSRTTDTKADSASGGSLPKGDSPPSSFDWRDVGGRAYIDPVRDQGSCGACYSFGACAAAEGAYNQATESYDANCIDFSESYIAWCLGTYGSYSSHFDGCDGADYGYYEVRALTVEGVCLESSFPYTETDPGSCTHGGDSTIIFESWGRVDCGDLTAIKNAIITYGVVDAAVMVTDEFSDYSGGVYEDTNTSCSASPCYDKPSNHAIALVGWDDNPPEGGGGVWILRNSWGSSWGETGYMRIRYESAGVACAVVYVEYDAALVAPVAADDTYATNRNASLSVAAPGVLGNDHDNNGDPLTAAVVESTTNGVLVLSADGSFTYAPSTDWFGVDSFRYRVSDGVTGSDTGLVTISVSLPSVQLLSEDFESAFSNGVPPGWSRTFETGLVEWVRDTADQNGTSAHGGTYCAKLYEASSTAVKTMLITPEIDFSTYTEDAELEFWHLQADWYGDQDELRVYYRTSSGGSWNLLETYTSNVSSWTKRTITLPNPGATYYVGFKGTAKYGYGLCLDDVVIGGAEPVAPPNEGPSVAITSPTEGTHACEGTNMPVTASATDVEGSVTNVSFYTDLGLLAVDVSDPYSTVWADIPVGTHDVWAMAYDDAGLATTSVVVQVVIDLDSDRDGLANDVDPDDDNDNMPDAYEIENGLNPTNALDAVEDEDGDGMSNVDECIAGTPADDPSQVLAATGAVGEESTGINCVSWASLTGQLYTLVRSTDLGTGWSNVAGQIDLPGTGELLTITNASFADLEYYKIQVRKEP